MRLYLLRHGEAEPYGSVSDAERRLVPAGESAVIRQRTWLEPVDAFYCSPYRRACQTAELIRSTVGGQQPMLDARLTPDSPVQGVLDLLGSAGGERLLLVGHNPLLSSLANSLIGDPYALALPTAGLVCLEADDWFPGSAQFLWQK
ncbi:SixA phosphatase family protein [Saccharospirillum mangrovi]|uniref:SixA phosphatase family protein n=1 Tax=Saccharospirillum mangrovi TaxID=2161747 RepID=UPI000D37A95F|nr:histidine phosphatase family protein [Saccharospirillum mangrovi]